jgi:hypothetical protein
MGKLSVTKKLQGDFGELIFEHFSLQNNYAYITLEEIYLSFTPQKKLLFRFGNKRIPVKVPNDICDEVVHFCEPTNKNDIEPHYVFDFLTVSLNFSFKKTDDGKFIQEPYLTKKAFNWIEIKTGNAKLSKNQKLYKDQSIIGVQVFRIKNDLPEYFEVSFEGSHSKDKAEKEKLEKLDLLI